MANIESYILHVQNNVKQYIIDNNIKSLIIGISGGIDSTVNAAMLKPICDELNIPLIGRYISIESNKPIEQESAELVGNAFCSNFELIDWTPEFQNLKNALITEQDDVNDTSFKIRMGNIKARMRMVCLRDLTQKNHGLMIDNSNLTEYNLGFFTISDNGDISPMRNIWKTTVYDIANFLSETYNTNNELEKKKAIDFSISLTPTDGLGISNSDLEQIGAKSYSDVDNILAWVISFPEKYVKKYLNKDEISDKSTEESLNNVFNSLYNKYTKEVVLNVVNRWLKSSYKRKHLPIII